MPDFFILYERMCTFNLIKIIIERRLLIFDNSMHCIRVYVHTHGVHNLFSSVTRDFLRLIFLLEFLKADFEQVF